jgi:hypothetical protein
MRIEFILLLAVLILTGESLAGSNSVKTNVGTSTITNVLFKPADWDRGVGGGYAISTNAQGEDHTVLNFASKTDFKILEDRTISIEMGSKTLSTGATTFGMMAAVTQKYYTQNGYRSSEFSTNSYTIMPYKFDIENIASGTLSCNKADGENKNKVTVGARSTISDLRVKMMDFCRPIPPMIRHWKAFRVLAGRMVLDTRT